MDSSRVAAALERFRLTEAEIHAWVEVSPREPLHEGLLSGVPFGVKDIFETRGLCTAYGAEIYRGRNGIRDAAAVARLCEQGAVLFGKTETTAFAYFDPAPTRNPRNPAHTPGGSSSGSAAAVAAGVVPFALGSQTMGSIIRPASFCGIAGFKPTYGVLPVDGMMPFAPSLDTVGFLAESTAVCRQVWHALGFPVGAPHRIRFAVCEGLPVVLPEMQLAFDHAASLLVSSGYPLELVQLPVPYKELLTAVRQVNDYEGARSHYERWKEFGTRLGEKLAGLVARGVMICEEEYRRQLLLLRDVGSKVDAMFGDEVVLLTPAAPGPAPVGLESTGDPVMNAVWTGLGTPALSIPMPYGTGLPLGLQLIARRGAEAALLHAGALLEEVFGKVLILCGSPRGNLRKDSGQFTAPPLTRGASKRPGRTPRT
ncbi:MAG: amidase [Bryobacteraceae bacterium]|nr:amidase [Bryobacterales bacterium]NUN02190.1 amidase [Bryobacteraceae bacterium]